jgi:hypothetical protein
MRRLSLLIIFGLILSACENDERITTYKDTYNDDIADITFIGNAFYTTNYDLSGNAGSQIDLFKFTADGCVVDDAYDLGMNGQGYLAMTNNGRDIYLQSRNFNWVIKCSPVGELVYILSDTLSPNWSAGGICYRDDLDSLVLFYRNTDKPRQYRVRTVSTADPSEASRDLTVEFNVLNESVGLYAADYYNSNFYLLGVDSTGADLLIVTDADLNVTATDTISDSTVVGLCHKDDKLYLSYRDRRIEPF